MSTLPLIFGALVGFSLGLTGGGGALFAAPLLIYGLGVPPPDAVGISLITVGATSLVGLVQRALRRQVEIPTGLLFAAAGMIVAPAGSWLARRIPDTVLLGMFALLMLVIAIRMWMNASGHANEFSAAVDDNSGPACQRDPLGTLKLTSDCALLLAGIGIATGLLTGLFGVGGGFIIVPALVTFSSMGMQRAIGTSLLIVTLVSASGAASHLAAGKELPIALAGIFILGSVAGLLLGSRLSRKFSGPILQKIFGAAIAFVALYVLVRELG